MEVYRAHPEVVQHVQALNEDPVSDICQARAGRVWLLKDAPPAPPWHPNCKTSLIPVLRPLSRMERRQMPQRLRDELGALSKEQRIGLDGKPAQGLTPQEIFRKMPRQQQLKRLGKGRLELFEAGKLNFRQLVDQTGRPRTLDELKALAE